jgi:acyl-CoA thioesterase-1
MTDCAVFRRSRPSKRCAPLLQDIKAANAEPLLMQIRLPANYGRRYNEAFSAIYPKLAKEFDIPLLPFFMEEVYLKPQWMQDDGIHQSRRSAVYCRLDGNAAGSFS